MIKNDGFYTFGAPGASLSTSTIVDRYQTEQISPTYYTKTNSPNPLHNALEIKELKARLDIVNTTVNELDETSVTNQEFQSLSSEVINIQNLINTQIIPDISDLHQQLEELGIVVLGMNPKYVEYEYSFNNKIVKEIVFRDSNKEIKDRESLYSYDDDYNIIGAVISFYSNEMPWTIVKIVEEEYIYNNEGRIESVNRKVT